MSRRWSKLQSRVYNIMDPALNFQIHCALYEMNSNNGYHGSKLPRYWITIGKDIVFDYPKQFDTTYKYGRNSYPWDTDISNISDSIEEYLQTPRNELLEQFSNDKCKVTDILRLCDRRIGKRQLLKMYDTLENETLKNIVRLRLNNNK